MEAFENFSIETIPNKGEGMVAMVSIPKGESFLIEEPFCGSLYLENSHMKYLLCHQCLRPLETITEQFKRHLASEEDLLQTDEKDKLNFLFTKILQSVQIPAPPPNFPCYLGCEARYCSEKCAWKDYEFNHQLLCPCSALRVVAPQEWGFKWKIGELKHEDHVFLLLRILAGIAQNWYTKGPEKAKEILVELESFCFYPWSTIPFGQPASLSQEAYLKEKCTLVEILSQDLFMLFKDLPSLFNSAGQGQDKTTEKEPQDQEFLQFLSELVKAKSLDRFLGSISQNTQERSPQLSLAPFLESLQKNSQLETHIEFVQLLSTSTLESWKNRIICETKGQALFLIHSKLNHSCQPNAVVLPTKNSNSHVEVYALRDISPGEEICISYIDEQANLEVRNALLKGHYLFECKCPKCQFERKSE